MAFDPLSGALWTSENGDDTFDEINRVDPGFNSGWIQIMGPAARVSQFKEIETTLPPMTLQQLRWPPTRIADAVGSDFTALPDLPTLFRTFLEQHL
jgi:aldose sugar dehydrogenase